MLEMLDYLSTLFIEALSMLIAGTVIFGSLFAFLIWLVIPLTKAPSPRAWSLLAFFLWLVIPTDSKS